MGDAPAEEWANGCTQPVHERGSARSDAADTSSYLGRAYIFSGSNDGAQSRHCPLHSIQRVDSQCIPECPRADSETGCEFAGRIGRAMAALSTTRTQRVSQGRLRGISAPSAARAHWMRRQHRVRLPMTCAKLKNYAQNANACGARLSLVHI
jgi:hypothetical protein